MHNKWAPTVAQHERNGFIAIAVKNENKLS